MKLSPVPCLLSPGIRRRGIAMAMSLAALLAVTLVAGALVTSLLASHRQSKRYAAELQAQWLAEAGLARASAQLAREADYTGETWPAAVSGSESDAGLVTIRIEPATNSDPRKIIVEAIYPPHEHNRVLIRREQALTPDS
jgi:Tfp pilus assembly protein PilX